MHKYRVLEQSHTYSTSNTYRYTHIHIHTLRLIPKMGTKVRNRNLRLNHSKTFPIPTKFYQSSSFYILYTMPIKKTPNKSRTKTRFGEQSPARISARVGSRCQPRGRAGSSSCAAQTQNPTILQQNQVYTTSLHFQLHPITWNYTLNFKIGDQFITFNPMIQLTLICIN